MFNFRVDFDRRALEKRVRGVKDVSLGHFLGLLPLEQYAEWLRARLERESPKSGSKGGGTPWLRYIRAGGSSKGPWAEIQEPKFSEGWRVETQRNRASISLHVFHKLLSMGEMGKARFWSTISGARAHTVTAPRSYWVKLRSGWHFFPENFKLNIGATEGTPVLERTTVYIEGWLRQRMQRDIRELIERSL